MAAHNELGKRGEEIAIQHLRASKYDILEVNWKSGGNEIDIIATNHKEVIFVEVKTRSSKQFGPPEIAVNKQKQRVLIRSAERYIVYHELDMGARFDIISIIISSEGIELEHLEDAFYATL